MTGGLILNSEIFVFLRKFLATLYMHGVHDIPLSGPEYTAGVSALEATLQEILPDKAYDKISDVFLKTPVQEEYNQFRDALIELNGDVVGFSAMKNPYWRTLSISMNQYYADRILNDDTDIGVSNEEFHFITLNFCEAAGVLVWERF